MIQLKKTKNGGMKTLVTIYTLPSCVQCDSTKKLFAKNSINYTEVDLTQDEQAFEMVSSLGYVSAPVVIAGDDHWSGFRPDKILSLLVA